MDSLNLAIRRREIFGLLGPNGAGKTTTIGMLTTRVQPTSGRAFIGAIDVAASPAMAKRVIGVVTQTNTLDRALTVAENLYYHGLYFGMRSKSARLRTDELLELFLLKDRANAEVDELSGGMAQRLLIARALVHDPAAHCHALRTAEAAGADPAVVGGVGGEAAALAEDAVRRLARQRVAVLTRPGANVANTKGPPTTIVAFVGRVPPLSEVAEPMNTTLTD